MVLQPLKITEANDEAANHEDEQRRAYIRRAFGKLLRVMGAFGVTSSTGGTQQSKCSEICRTVRLIAAVCLVMLFLAQFTHLFLRAIATVGTATALKLHFLSRSQSTLTTALGLIILSRRSRKLPSVLSSIASACTWSSDSEFRPLRRFITFSMAYLACLYCVVLPVGLLMKVLMVRGLNESFLGWTITAEVVSFGMLLIEATAVSFRSTHLMMMIMTCLTLGMQFAYLTGSMKTFRQGWSINKSAGEYASGMSDLLYRHYRLSKLVHQFDAIFSASLFLFTASDLIVVTSLISYFISGHRLEAKMGHYVTGTDLDHGMFMNGAVGGVLLILTRVIVTAYLSYRAESCIPELHMILEDPTSTWT
ncbi:hypothetical protein BV898_17584 [Hypsibius exemplaris]|uniref:Uncharacterized protein n=1 Tax=Hypsibius exemplaris TaxID=2072580 RepID=A0A9X6RML1_HYPEX|nr:hypothetical protein BV898_17584 [Hypsibius exemplaris]